MESLKNIEVEKNKENQSIWVNKNFLFLWSGNAISILTFNIYTLALPIIIYNLTQSALAMSTMRSIEVIPNLLLGFLIGVIVDRYNRKNILLFSIIIQMFMIITLIVLLINNTINIWFLYLVGFFIYAFGNMFSNAYHSILPQLVSKEQLLSANSTISFVKNTINLIGPAFAGYILLLNYEIGLIITLIGMFMLFICITCIRVPKNEFNDKNNKRKDIIIDMKEGFNFLLKNTEILSSTLMILSINIATSASSAILIFYALESYSLTEKHIGFILTGAAIGGLVASLVSKKVLILFKKRWNVFKLGIFLIAIGNLLNYSAYGWYVLCFGMFSIGFGALIINIHFLTLRQVETPNHLLGRVTGLSSMIMKMAMPISYLIIGFIAEYIQVKKIFLGTAFFLIFLFVAISIVSYKKKF
ncbi:MFS transporter [Alkalihalobacillus sp. LMS39]|uniref:MFS transporter n=1 Tax=Alkalihalobacillus sp. LMS39 TaxID=2924032 RepID=UPI001FB50F8A|nr:MFS transporter [Alkalihalobacillus sp. LMS39]UOE95080.1 MFS transporter [Alkalihalobacillus sp. LMS39]